MSTRLRLGVGASAWVVAVASTLGLLVPVAASRPDGQAVSGLSTVDAAVVYLAPHGQLEVWNLDETVAPRRVTPPGARDDAAGWFPDGSAIAFIRRQGSGKGLYVVDRAGQRPRLIAAGQVSDYSLSPNGRRVAYTLRAEGKRHLYVRAISGGPARRVLRVRTWAVVTWSLDGRYLSVRTEGQCSDERRIRWLIAKADGGGSRCIDLTKRVVPEDEEVLAYQGEDVLGWTASGRLVYAISTYDDRGYPRSGVLYSVRRDGTDRRELARGAILRGGVVSPDGRWIAYAIRSGDLMVIRAAGAQRRRLLEGGVAPGGHELSWTPDGRRVVVSQACCVYDRGYELATVDRETAKKALVAAEHVTSYATSSDGSLWAVGSYLTDTPPRGDSRVAIALSRHNDETLLVTSIPPPLSSARVVQGGSAKLSINGRG